MPFAINQLSYARKALIFVCVVLAFRLIYAALFAENPAGDEAYYWDWGRQLDIGYYSKPPFIAWLYGFVDWIGGGSLFAIRATAAVLASISLLLIYGLAASVFDSRVGWVAVIIGVTVPANAVLSFFLTIDAPLMLLWTGALWMFWRFLSGGGWSALILLLLCLGIGHLTKQMMMIFPVLAIIFLAASDEHRKFLRHPGLLLVLFGSYLSLLPPLIWNANNDWITFQHTGHHFQSGPTEGSVILKRIEKFFEFLATQLGVLGPITGVILYGLCLGSLKSLRRVSPELAYLLVFSAIPLIGMLILAMRQSLQPNWPAVFYVAGIVLSAHWFVGTWQTRFPPVILRRYFPLAIGLSAALASYFYLGPLFFKAIGKEGHTADPDRRIMSHSLVADEFHALRETVEDGENHFIVALGHRDSTSHLAFALPDQPRVYRWKNGGRVESQYELWNNPIEDELGGKDALILKGGTGDVPEDVRAAFGSVERVGTFEVRFGYDRVRQYSVDRGIDLKSWPLIDKPNPDSTNKP